jgi:hypothetical protein
VMVRLAWVGEKVSVSNAVRMASSSRRMCKGYEFFTPRTICT